MVPSRWRWLWRAAWGIPFAGNLLAAVLGRPTTCMTLREDFDVDTPSGRIKLTLTLSGLSVLWLIHLLNPKKRPTKET